MLSRACFVVALAAACSSKQEAPPPAPPQVLADAGVDGVTTIVGFDPASGMHLDEDGPGKGTTARKVKGPAVPIGIMLKSEPAGATVFVDGENLGITPRYWAGVADGSEHEFAFTKPNYALARYRFVPVTNGVLHATLERVSSGETLDAGLDPIIAPTFSPDAAVAPPPTVLAPPDAAPRPEPAQGDAAAEPPPAPASPPPAPASPPDAAAPQPTGPTP